MVEAVIVTLRRLPIWLALLAFSFHASAHRLDEYLQATLVVIEPGSIKLQINLTPGMAVAVPVLAMIDRDRDGVISTNEAAAYAERFRQDLTLQLDQRPLELNCTAVAFPMPDELRAGWGIIQLEYAATPSSLAAGAHELAFENRHQTNISVYLLNAALPKSSAIQITRQARNESQSIGQIEFTFLPAPEKSSGARRVVLAVGIVSVTVVVGALVWRKRPATAH
jgi:hypothetical protein